MLLFYRISDKSYPKAKLPGATKAVCYSNFRSVFETPGNSITVIADNVNEETTQFLKGNVLQTNLGNAGSFRKAFELALEADQDEIVYFCEDDYLHRFNAATLIEEGIKRSEYVTLYDHPDKYTRYYNGGEFSKVIKTASSHWRFTASTCMTFAAKVKTLREDVETWKKFTEGDHPHDHHIFMELGEKKRRLAVSIPGAACHTDLTFCQHMKGDHMDGWAVDMMSNRVHTDFLRKIETINPEADFFELADKTLLNKQGYQRLLVLDSLMIYLDGRCSKKSRL